MSRNHPCLVIAGPTASGKSELALQLAEHFDCEIINYDSVQVYVGFNIASAKILQSQRRGILHHLIDHVDAENSYSAGGFANDAQDVLNHITSRGKMPLLVGGTGLYLEALLKGFFQDQKVTRNSARDCRILLTASLEVTCPGFSKDLILMALKRFTLTILIS